MKVGVFYFPVDYGINIAELARALEERGFESLFVPEHTHIPVSRRSAVPERRRTAEALRAYARPVRRAVLRRRGDEKPAARHRHLPDPGARPDRHREGGREPRPALGRPLRVRDRRRLERRGDGKPRRRYNTRFKLMRERILAMKALWTQDEAEYHGEMVDFDQVWSYPKPAQKPHPPILLGGETDYTLRRVVEYCDGWFPRPGRGVEIRDQLDRLRRMAEEKGRDPEDDLDLGVSRADRQGGAQGIRGGGHRPRGAGNSRREPRRNPARPRPLRPTVEIVRVPGQTALSL